MTSNAALSTYDPGLVTECIRDQGQYHEAFGEIVTCFRCGKTRQFLNQCVCGAWSAVDVRPSSIRRNFIG